MTEAMKKHRLMEAEENVRIARALANWRQDRSSEKALERVLAYLKKIEEEAVTA